MNQGDNLPDLLIGDGGGDACTVSCRQFSGVFFESIGLMSVRSVGDTASGTIVPSFT